MANYMLLEDVKEIVIYFKNGKRLELTDSQIEALTKYQDVNCININGIDFIRSRLMLDFTEYVKNHKCMNCIHAPVCTNNLGGADLDIVGTNCPNYLPADGVVQLPTKFYIIFNVPGFYNITEYKVDRVSYSKGLLDKMWGSSKHDKAVAYSVDIGRLVFFTREEAEAGMQKLIEEHKTYG